MKHKHYFLLTLAALFLIALACWFSVAALGSQAGTIALGYAVGEQAQANQEMARALGTQSRSNAWIIFFVVAGMLAAMAVGIWAGTRSTRQAPPTLPYPDEMGLRQASARGRQLPPPVELLEANPELAAEWVDALLAGGRWDE